MTLAFLNIGTQEMILIVIVILLLFGGKKLPELARGLGRGIREFKDASEGIKKEISDQINNFEKDLDVTVEENPKTYTANVQDEKVSQDVEGVEKVDAETSAEKKFPQFSAPENTYQHNPGGHPVDDTEYYKYGYNDDATIERINAEGADSTVELAEEPMDKETEKNGPSKEA